MEHAAPVRQRGGNRPSQGRAPRSVPRRAPAVNFTGCTVLADAEREPERWQAARRTLITASDVPILLGLRPGLVALWYEKAGWIAVDPIAADDEPEHLQIGHDLEAPNAEVIYARKTRRVVRRSQQLLRSERYPFLGATIDYATWIPAFGDVPLPLELKSTTVEDKWPPDAEPCLDFQTQLQAQMLVTGAPAGSLSAIVAARGGMRHRWCDYARHDGCAALIAAKAEAFMESVRRGVPPPIDADSSTHDALRAVEALAGTRKMLPREAIQWDAEIIRVRREIAALAEQQRYYENLLMAAIGTAECGELPDGSGAYSFRIEHRRAYTVRASSSRRLRRVKS